jgi:diguanylate cyclase (GGDEF)-like protein
VASAWRFRVAFVHVFLLSMGVVATALLASLRGRGRAELFALYAFLALALDALGQLAAPQGWPTWPLFVVLVGAVAVAESLTTALGVAALVAVLAGAEAAAQAPPAWRTGAASAFGYLALAFAIDRARAAEKKRLSASLAELARLKHGIDQLDDAVAGDSRISPGALTLRQVSEDGRRARQLDRATELDEALQRLVDVACRAVSAHAILYFEVDRERESARLRAGAGPPALIRDSVVPLSQDPFGFVLQRNQSFYATDFKRLLWNLPYYRSEVKVGSLLALPVRTGDVVLGVLVAERMEIQSLTGTEPELLDAFARMTGEAIQQARASLGREELGAEFKAAYAISQKLATLGREADVRDLLLRSARNLVSLDGAAVVMTDDQQARYSVEEAYGWALEHAGTEVDLGERTWAAWVLRSTEEPYLLDNVASHKDRMPFLVPREGSMRADSLLSVPLRVDNRNLGALLLTSRRGAFDAATLRVLGILANQAAAVISAIRQRELWKEVAGRDSLTGLYNRRAFSEHLTQAQAREDRQKGRFALLLLDIDHFKKLNDTFGHPAGDAALRATAQVLLRMLRKGDQAARFGGEEFTAILPATDSAGALQLAERLRSAIEKSELVFEGARLSVTASIGVAVWPGDGVDGAALVGAADRALYTAKQGGRNRVMAAATLPPVAAAEPEPGAAT